MRDDDKAGRARRVDDVALVDQSGTRASRQRRFDRGVIELDLRSFYVGLVGGKGGLELLDQRSLRVDLLLGIGQGA